MKCEKVNMDNYRFYLPLRVRNFESAEPDFSSLIHYSGASFSLGDGYLDGCTSRDDVSDDDATFSFQTCLGCGLDFGIVYLSFAIYPSSSFFGS